MKLRHAITFALLAVPAFATAAPAPASDTMQVSLNLENSCTIDIDDIDFGVHTALAADVHAQTQMRIRCTGISPILWVDVSGGGSGDVNNRKLSDGKGNTLNYQVSAYRDFAPMNPRHGWAGFGQNLTWTLHGRLYATAAPLIAGSYSDTLVATVTF